MLNGPIGVIGAYTLKGTVGLSDFKNLMSGLYNMSIMDFARQVLVWYLIIVISYSLISYIVFSHRYAGMRKKMKKYYNSIRKLRKMYEKE
jgi:hypothetical protein